MRALTSCIAALIVAGVFSCAETDEHRDGGEIGQDGGGDVHVQDPEYCQAGLCPAIEQADCPAITSDCVSACRELGDNAFEKGCSSLEYFRCTEEARVSCDEVGRPFFEGCEDELNTLTWCIEGRLEDGGFVVADVGVVEHDAGSGGK